MSEFANQPESSSNTSRLDNASKYLHERLESAGSLSDLVLSIQHDYGESDTSKGQLYQLLHIARFVTRSTMPEKDISPKVLHSIYAGELLGMSVIDHMTSHENNIPSTLLSDLYRRMYAQWEQHTEGFDFSLMYNDPKTVHNRIWPKLSDAYAMNHDVAMSVLGPAAAFAELPENQELKELIKSLLKGIPSVNVLGVERGFWIIMREWLAPEYRESNVTTEVIRLAAPSEVPEHVLEGMVAVAKASLSYGATETSVLTELEADLAADDIELDILEWNRRSLHTEAKDIVYQAARLRVTGQSFFTSTNPEQLKEAAERAEQDLNSYVREKFEFDEDDVFYAHGTFIGTAETDEEEILYQLLNEGDYRALTEEYDDRKYINYEVHGTFKKMVYTEAFSNADSYSVDVSKIEVPVPKLKQNSPAIQLEGVSVINMNTGHAVDYFKKLTIPLTHKHLELGRFVPPLPDEDDEFDSYQ